MEDDNFDDVAGDGSQPEANDLKKKAVAQSAQASGLTPEDQSRGVLHYGETHEGDSASGSAPDSTSAKRDGDASAAGGDAVEDSDTNPDSSATGLGIVSTEPDLQQPTDLPPSAESDASVPRQATTSPSQSGQAHSSGSETAVDSVLTDPRQGTGAGQDADPIEGNTEAKRGQTTAVEEADADRESTGHPLGENVETENDQMPKEGEKDVYSNEAPTQITLSNHAFAENTEGAVVGTLSVADQDTGDSHSFTVSDDRFEVVDGQIKLKDGISLDHEEAADLTLEVEATDSGGNTFTQSFEIAVADVPDVALGTGFHAKYFDMNQTIRAIDDVDWNGTVTHQELVDDINYTNSSNSFWEGGSKDTFGVQITGNIEVEEGGVFNFHIGGDDGVVLYIDGKKVVDNDGLHGFRTRSGEVELEPGAHVIEVRYFENYGHAGLKVEWEGPGIDGRELLSPPDMGDLQTVNGMPLAVSLETDMSQPVDGDFSQVIEGLPPGSVVQAGEMIADVDESGIADITGWDTSMLMVTPPVDFTGRVDAQISSKVTLESGDTAISTTELSFDVDQADITPSPPGMQAGFRASYFDVDHSLDRLDQIDWDADPTKEEVIGEINYENGRESFWEGGSKDTFGVRITGEITVDEAGSFDFYLGGDDGAVLYIDGVEVIDNDRLHSYRTRSGEIELEAGTHEIEIRYFENYGHAGLKLEWEGPGTDGRELVHADTDLSVPENGAIDIQLSNVDVGSTGSVTVSGLPADTILVSGENSIVSDGADVDLTGWDLDLVELMPPSGFEGIISAEVSVSGTAFNGEQYQTAETFEIEVGDVENQSQTNDSGEDLLLAEDGAQENGDSGWVEESSETDTEANEGSDDDVMEEPVSDSHSSEQSYEMTETYERNDW